MYLYNNFTLFPPLLHSPSPKLWTKLVILLYLPFRFDVKLDEPKFRFHCLCQSKVKEKKTFGIPLLLGIRKVNVTPNITYGQIGFKGAGISFHLPINKFKLVSFCKSSHSNIFVPVLVSLLNSNPLVEWNGDISGRKVEGM